MPSVISELGPLAPGRKSGIQLSWLYFQSCHGSALTISLLDGSLETLQACFFFHRVLFEVLRASSPDATTFLVQVTNIA